LNRKLELVSRTVETALGLLQARRSHRVEWYIVILIVFEILLTLYQLIFLGGHYRGGKSEVRSQRSEIRVQRAEIQIPNPKSKI
jgi:hypothetical protein